MTSFILKIIAVITMITDHSGYLIFNGFSFFNYIGRIAFPIFAFQISEGYSHTKNLKKYFLRLLIFAIISQIPYTLFESSIGKDFSFNVIFTLLFGLFSIFIYNKQKNKYLGLILVTLIALLSEIINLCYGAFGIIIIFIFHIFKNKKILMALSYVIICIIKYLPDLINYNFYYKLIILCIFTMLPILFILLYNGKKGKDFKYFLYLFYPMHLFLLYLVNIFT